MVLDIRAHGSMFLSTVVWKSGDRDMIGGGKKKKKETSHHSKKSQDGGFYCAYSVHCRPDLDRLLKLGSTGANY